MKDLLFAVKQPDTNPFYDQEAAVPGADQADRDMQSFFRLVEEVNMDLADINARQKDLQQQHERGKTIARSKEMKNHLENMQAATTAVTQAAHNVKAKIEALDKSNQHSLKMAGCGPGSATERTRTSITAGLKKKMKDQMLEFSRMRSRIQDDYRSVVERRVYTVTGQHASEEQIDRLIETGDAENIFQRAILEQGRGRVLEVLTEIQERHNAVMQLEHSLKEVHQIYLDMAVLVDHQGEQLDNIESQVGRSKSYVATGKDQLVGAKNYQKAKRKYCCYALILLIIILIIVAIIIFTTKPWEMVK